MSIDRTARNAALEGSSERGARGGYTASRAAVSESSFEEGFHLVHRGVPLIVELALFFSSVRESDQNELSRLVSTPAIIAAARPASFRDRSCAACAPASF